MMKQNVFLGSDDLLRIELLLVCDQQEFLSLPESLQLQFISPHGFTDTLYVITPLVQ